MASPSSHSLDELLQPTLATQSAKRPYSVRASFMVAFFGGAPAMAIFGALTARQMGTLAKDAWLFVVLLLSSLASTYWIAGAASHGGLPAWLPSFENSTSALRLVSRVLGLLGMGVFYLRRGEIWRAAETYGDRPPSPWSAAIPSIGISILVTGLVAILVK